jgi:acetylornithine deacetylase/succinyl-diaminopimelate desuccinylase-like protein
MTRLVASHRRRAKPTGVGHIPRHTRKGPEAESSLLRVSSNTSFHPLTFTIDRHYDVISAPPEGWVSEPFTLTGRNGYLYGRGVSDNKGPILAVACAATELLGQRALGLDLVFLIEGEEEVGSYGFGEAIEKHKVKTAVPLSLVNVV